jgi:hypothetical protein
MMTGRRVVVVVAVAVVVEATWRTFRYPRRCVESPKSPTSRCQRRSVVYHLGDSWENINTKRNNRKSGPNADLYTAHMKDLFEAAKNPKISPAEFEELHAEMKEKYGNFSPAISRLRNAREQRRLTNSGYTQKVEDLKRLAMNKGISDKDLETKLQALQKEHGDERYCVGPREEHSGSATDVGDNE